MISIHKRKKTKYFTYNVTFYSTQFIIRRKWKLKWTPFQDYANGAANHCRKLVVLFSLFLCFIFFTTSHKFHAIINTFNHTHGETLNKWWKPNKVIFFFSLCTPLYACTNNAEKRAREREQEKNNEWKWIETNGRIIRNGKEKRKQRSQLLFRFLLARYWHSGNALLYCFVLVLLTTLHRHSLSLIQINWGKGKNI